MMSSGIGRISPLLLLLLLPLLLLVVGTVVCTAGDYTNPVINANHPDPGVYYENGTYYAATTSGDAPDAFPIMVSKDLVTWALGGYVFPANATGRPRWAVSDYWAPEIHYIGPNLYNVYFAARNTNGTLCVGVASGPTPLGPFKDIGEPLVYTPGMGNIDASFYRDDGTEFVRMQSPLSPSPLRFFLPRCLAIVYISPHPPQLNSRAPLHALIPLSFRLPPIFNSYLIWKRDGNGAFPPVPTPIFIQKLSNNGTVRVGTATVAITNDQSWEGPLVEGPWIVKEGTTYYMFYSANGFTSPKYAIGVARAPAILGPYEKLATNPILHENSATALDTFVGPGHCSVIQTQHARQWYVIYHAWHRYKVGGSNPRVMNVDQVLFGGDGWPYVNASQPSYSPTPNPSL